MQRKMSIALAAWLMAAVPVLAQTSALDLVPADALGFAVINNLEKTSDKVEALLKRVKAAPLPGSPLKLALADLGVTKGVDEKGSLVAAALPGDGKPVALIIIPVSSYKDFAQSLKAKDTDGAVTELEVKGKSMVMGKKGDFAILAEAEQKADLKKALQGGGGIGTSVKPLQAWLADNDLGLVVTPKGVQFIVAKVREGLGQAKNINLPEEAKFVTGMIDGIDKFLQNATNEVTHLALGTKIQGNGDLQVDIQALFATGGKFAKFGGQAKGMAGGPLAGLPAQPYVLAAGGGISEMTMKALAGFGVNIIKATAQDLPEELVKKLDQAYAGMYQGVAGTSFAMGVGKAGDSVMGGVTVAMKVDDSVAFLKRYEKSMTDLNEVLKTGKVPFQKGFELKKAKVGDLPALEIVNDMSDNPGLQMIPKAAEIIFGEGGKLRASIVPVDDTTILIGYASPTEMKKILDRYQKKAYLSEDAELGKTTAMLPKGAQWAGYFNPKGAMDMVQRLIGGLGVPFQLPNFPQTPPVGAALRLSETGLQVRLVVPGSVLEGVGDVVQKLMQLQAGAN